jgi:hypothetical protein
VREERFESVWENLQERVLSPGAELDHEEIRRELLAVGHTEGSADVCIRALELMRGVLVENEERWHARRVEEYASMTPEERESEVARIRELVQLEARLKMMEAASERMDELFEEMKEVYRREKGL